MHLCVDVNVNGHMASIYGNLDDSSFYADWPMFRIPYMDGCCRHAKRGSQFKRPQKERIVSEIYRLSIEVRDCV